MKDSSARQKDNVGKFVAIGVLLDGMGDSFLLASCDNF